MRPPSFDSGLVLHELLQDLFQSVGQQHTPPLRRLEKGGIGIGLWLSRIIMENHGGDIECKNMPGGGASFMISIPSWDQTDTKRKSPGY